VNQFLDESNYTDDLDNARRLALQGIGQNVVAFQKMEAMLKFLVANYRIQGLPSQLDDIREKRNREVDRQTMGRLVDKLFRSMVVDGENEKDELVAPAGGASIRMSIEVDAEEHRETREAFQLIVQERNALIHKMLVRFDPNSLASCLEVSKTLDAQRSRLKPHYEYLRSMAKGVTAGYKSLLDLIDSEEFPEKLDELNSGAQQ
jgi:hypothetical protein